ncbi:hypothetical protein BGX27_005779 [Mortierella sp. AM989]|nr:hypothetical protein BGX27_005779 [Mortierella sp. AM989]
MDTAAPPSYGSLTPIQSSSIRICTISLLDKNKIRLIGTPPPLTPLLRSTIITCWGTILDESNYSGAHEFKLSGAPFRGEGPDLVRSRRLLLGLLYTMARAGWDLLQATDVSRREQDNDTLFFEYAGSIGGSSSSSGTVTPGGIDAAGLREVELFAVSFNRTDRIRVISQQSPEATFRMMELIKQAVASQWKYGIQSEKDYCGAMEIKLQGNPFGARGDQSVYARMMQAQMIANFRAEGFKLYTSIGLGTGKDGKDVESWISIHPVTLHSLNTSAPVMNALKCLKTPAVSSITAARNVIATRALSSTSVVAKNIRSDLKQAANRDSTWSESQIEKKLAFQGPRFENTDIDAQPKPRAAIELIAEEPIRLVEGRRARCDGGGGSLGHPQVWINLVNTLWGFFRMYLSINWDATDGTSCHGYADRPGAHACGYCGIRFEQKPHHHHH